MCTLSIHRHGQTWSARAFESFEFDPTSEGPWSALENLENQKMPQTAGFASDSGFHTPGFSQIGAIIICNRPYRYLARGQDTWSKIPSSKCFFYACTLLVPTCFVSLLTGTYFSSFSIVSLFHSIISTRSQATVLTYAACI